MEKDKKPFIAERRLFLKGAAVASGTAALTAVSATALVDPATVAATADRNAQPVSKGYHETQHIMDYYRTLRS